MFSPGVPAALPLACEVVGDGSAANKKPLLTKYAAHHLQGCGETCSAKITEQNRLRLPAADSLVQLLPETVLLLSEDRAAPRFLYSRSPHVT